MLNNSSAKKEYPISWVKSPCLTCSYFSGLGENWNWSCAHPDEPKDLGLHSEPRLECYSYTPSLIAVINRIYFMCAKLRSDFEMDIEIDSIEIDTIQDSNISINGKKRNIVITLNILNALYKDSVTHKQARDNLNYSRHILNLKEIS